MSNLHTDRQYSTNSFENPYYVEESDDDDEPEADDDDNNDNSTNQQTIGAKSDSKEYTASTPSSQTPDGENDDFNDDSQRYGWFSFRPQCLQWLNNPKGYLFFLCVYCFGQGMTVNGLVYVIITTLERRFNLQSVQSAFVSSAYDLMSMLFIIFVTYFGEKANKPRLIGTGALIFACGSVVFTLPHFLSGLYNFEAAEFDTCDFNRTEPDLCSLDYEEDEDLSKYYVIFVIAQGLHALGACSLYNLGITYLDENSPPGAAAVYTGRLTS